MTARKKSGGTKAAKGKRLSLSKRTLRDLPVGNEGPKGAWIRRPISWTCPQPRVGP